MGGGYQPPPSHYKYKEQQTQGLEATFEEDSNAMAPRLRLLLLLLSVVGPSWSQLRLFNLRASDLPSSLFGTTDGYVKVFCGSASLGETSVRDNTPNPWWEEEFSHFKAQQNDILRLEVHDSDFLFDDLLGVCSRQIKPGTHSHDCYLEKGGTLHYSYTLNPAGQQA